MGRSPDVLFFVEDPGAANFIAPLPAALGARGRTSKVIATGTGRGILNSRGVDFTSTNHAVTDEALLARNAPRLVAVGTSSNPDTRGLTLVQAARHAGIATVGVVDAAMNSSFRFRGRSDKPLAYAPDWILVPDDVVRNSFLEFGAASERVLALGHPHYDFILGLAETWRHQPHPHFRDRIFPEATAGRPIVVFVSEGSARAAPLSEKDLAEYTLRGRGGSNGRTEIVLEELIDALAGASPKPYLVLRVHPKDDEKDFASYSPMLDKISKDEPALEVVYAADLVVGMTSMLLTEASLLGRATLSILPRENEKQWLPGIRAGITPVVTSRVQISAALSQLLIQMPGAIAQPTKGFLDYGSTRYVVDFVEQLLDTNN